MKKIFCVVLALVAVLSLSLVTFAHPLTPVQPEKEVVIEIEKEEDFFQYPCESNSTSTAGQNPPILAVPSLLT